MKRYRITHTNLTTNEALSDADIWTGMAGVETVEDLGSIEVSEPAFSPTISRIRFDAVFAEALGEIAYDDALDTLSSIAATTPKTANSVAVKRTLRGLDNSPVGINRPLTDWRTPQDQDLTAHFIALVASVLTPTDPDIADKIDAGLNAWPRV